MFVPERKNDGYEGDRRSKIRPGRKLDKYRKGSDKKCGRVQTMR